MLAKLYEVFTAEEATLVEVNPLIVTPDRDVKALDAKVTLDGNALYRHAENAELRDLSQRGPAGADGQGARPHLRQARRRHRDPRQRRRAVMSTLDVVAEAGGAPANFLDAGGGSRADAITSAVEVILSDPKVKAVLFNIFGGITRCDEVAKGLIEAFAQIKPDGAVRRPPRRHQRRGGPRSCWPRPQLPNVYTESTMDGAAAKVVELAAGAGMSILVDTETRLCTSGITGREGTFHSLRNRDYGTKVVGGVTPGKGGQDVEGIPVFNTFHEAVDKAGANTAMIFVPPRFAADSILEAEDAGIELIICITEGIPAHDELRVYNTLKKNGRSRLIGPNCPGILSPGKASVGIIPASFFSEGNVGVVSRSGTLTYQIGNVLAQSGFGNSTIVGIGGDPVPGTDFIDVIGMFQDDPETELIVMCGEIGGDAEERAADFIAENVTKPVIGYIAGFTAPPGKTMGHAGAIVSGSHGTAVAKAEALESQGRARRPHPDAGRRGRRLAARQRRLILAARCGVSSVSCRTSTCSRSSDGTPRRRTAPSRSPLTCACRASGAADRRGRRSSSSTRASLRARAEQLEPTVPARRRPG